MSDKELELVEKRNEKIEEYIKKLDDEYKVEAVSMAERPKWYDKAVSVDETRIKKTLETGGIPNTDTSVKIPGKASKSIIIVSLKQK